MGEIAYLRLEKVNMVSREHNTRELIPDYVNRDLMGNNAYYFFDEKGDLISKPTQSHRELEAELKQLYQDCTGQKIQEKMNPLMEGLFLFSERNTNEEILQSVKRFGKEFGVNIIELHLHRDEGYYNRDEEWIPNLHGHFVFENIERRDVFVMQKKKKGADKGKEVKMNLKGRTHKFNKTETSKMQDFFAEHLGLKRGKSNSREHLTHIEWKNKKIREEYEEIKAEIKEKEQLNLQLEQEIGEKKGILTADISLKDFKEQNFLGGRWNVEKLQGLLDNVKILQSENHELRESIKREVLLERNRLKEAYKRKLEDREKAYSYLRRDFGELEQKLERKEEELIKAIHLVFNKDDREDYIKEKRERIHQRMMKGIEEIVEKEDIICYYQEMDMMIRAEMYQLDRKSNCWTLLNHVMGEDYEKKLYEKLAIIEQEIKKRKQLKEIKQRGEKEKEEIEKINETKETSISLSNQIQTTQQKEEQQVQHFRRKR